MDKVEITSERFLFSGNYTYLFKIIYDENVAYIKGEIYEKNNHAILIKDTCDNEVHIIILHSFGFFCSTYYASYNITLFGELLLYDGHDHKSTIVTDEFYPYQNFKAFLIAKSEEYLLMYDTKGYYYTYKKNNESLHYFEDFNFIQRFIPLNKDIRIVKNILYFVELEIDLNTRYRTCKNFNHLTPITNMRITPIYFVKSLVAQRSQEYRDRICAVIIIFKRIGICGKFRDYILSFF